MSPDPSNSARTPEEAKLPPMAVYVLGLLRRVPDRPTVSDQDAEAIQEGHLAQINRLREQGVLIVAGPIMDDGDLRGILIFRNLSLEEVRRLSEADPAVQRRRLMLELHQLYAPAGLGIGRSV